MKENIAPSSLPTLCPKSGLSVLEKEVSNLHLPFSDDDDLQSKASDASEFPKPFAAFGSFRQRHGDALDRYPLAHTVEAPAKLESSTMGVSTKLPPPVPYHHGKLRHKGKSCSTDLDREAAWERKKEQYLLEEEEEFCDGEEEYDADEGFDDDLYENEAEVDSTSESGDEGDDGVDSGKGKASVEDEVGDCNTKQVDVTRSFSRRGIYIKKKSMPMSRPPIKPLPRTRTRSLTDEDMDELRGSIDLGFGFSYSERSTLTGTLPALELYYAINRNLVDSKSRSTPASPLDGNVLLRTNSAGSTFSPSHETWRISSPGDHPTQVKTRLWHWAQAVACSVKQGY